MNRNLLWPVFACFAAALVGFAGLNPHLPGGGDNAEYIAQAQSLNDSGRRANIHLAGDPEDTFRPPLYPYLLAGLMRICGRNVLVFKAVNVLFALGAVVAAWWFLIAALGGQDQASHGYARQAARGPGSAAVPAAPSESGAAGADAERGACLRPLRQTQGLQLASTQSGGLCHVEAGWLTLWFALTPVLIFCAHDVLSDVPFVLVSLVALGCAARVGGPGGMRWLAATVALLLVAMLLRTAAFLMAEALCGYFLLEFVLRRRELECRRYLWAGIVSLVLAAGLLFWASRGPQTYVGSAQLSNRVEAFAGRVQDQGVLYGVSLAGEVVSHDTLWPYFPMPLFSPSICHQFRRLTHLPGMLLVGGLVLWGCVTCWRRRNRLIPMVWMLYMGALLLWPFFDARFYLPILPLFLALVWTGAQDLVMRACQHSVKVGWGVTFLLALLPTVCLVGALLSVGEPRATFMTGLEWGAGGLLLAGALIWLAARSAPETQPRRLAALLAVLIVSLTLLRAVNLNLIREYQWGPALPEPGWPEFYAAAKQVKERAGPGDVVVSAKTSLVWYWTGLKGVPIPITTDLPAALKALGRAQWAIVDDLPGETDGRRYLLPLLDADRGHWALLLEIPVLDERGLPVEGMTKVFRRRD